MSKSVASYKVRNSHLIVVLHTCIIHIVLSSGQISLAKAGHVLNFIFSYTHKRVT